MNNRNDTSQDYLGNNYQFNTPFYTAIRQLLLDEELTGEERQHLSEMMQLSYREIRFNVLTRKDKNGQTFLHNLISNRSLKIIKTIIESLEYEQEGDKTSLLRIRNNQADTILHYMLLNYYDNYNGDHDALERDFKVIFNLFPANERYSILFQTHNARMQTVFLLLPNTIFQEDLKSIYNTFLKINSFVKNKFSLPPEKNLTYSSTIINNLNNIFYGSQAYHIKFLEVAVAHFDSFNIYNIELQKEIYFLCYSDATLEFHCNSIAEIINLVSDEKLILPLSKEALRKNHSELIFIIQMHALFHRLKNDGYFICLLNDIKSTINNIKYRSLDNGQKNYIYSFYLLLSDLLIIYDTNHQSSLILKLRLAHSCVKFKIISDNGFKNEDIFEQYVFLQKNYNELTQTGLVNKPDLSSLLHLLSRPLDDFMMLHHHVEAYICNPHNQLSKIMEDALFEAFKDKVENYIDNTSDEDFNSLLCRQNINKQTVFHLLAKIGKVEVIRFMLNFVCDENRAKLLNIQDENGDTALHIVGLSYPDKFFQLFELYPHDKRFEALLTIKNNSGRSVLREQNDFINKDYSAYISRIYAGFCKFNELFLKTVTLTFYETYMQKMLSVVDSNEPDLINNLKLAFKYYPNYTSENMYLFSELYFSLTPIIKTDKVNTDVMLKIKSVLGQSSYSKKSDLNPLLINGIRLHMITLHHEKDLNITSLVGKRKQLIDLLIRNRNDYNNYSEIKYNITLLDNFSTDMLSACLSYTSEDNSARVSKKNELISHLVTAYNQCYVYYALSTIKLTIFNLFNQCREISDSIEKDHAKNKVSKNITKSRLARFIKEVLDQYKDVIDHHSIDDRDVNNITPVKNNLILDTNILNEDERNKLAFAFQIIYHIFYVHDHAMLKLKFTNQSFQLLDSDDQLARINASSDPLVIKSFELAKIYFNNFHIKNYELILKIYQELDPKVCSTFSVSYQLVYDIIQTIDDNMQNLSEKNAIIEKCSPFICYIKATLLEDSQQISDITIFSDRKRSLKFVSEFIEDIGDTCLMKNFNRLDLFICNLLIIYATNKPNTNTNFIENKTKLFDSLKMAYADCTAAGFITSEKVIAITEKLYHSCIAILKDLELNHNVNGHFDQSKFIKLLRKELRGFDPERFKSTNMKEVSLLSKFTSARKNPFSLSHDPKPLPAYLLTDDNNQLNDLNKYNSVIKLLSLPPRTHEMYQTLLSKTGEMIAPIDTRSKSKINLPFFESDKIDSKKIAVLQSIVDHINQSKNKLQNNECSFKKSLEELKSFFLTKIHELRSKSPRNKSETADALEDFITEIINPRIMSRINLSEDAASYYKKYRSPIPSTNI